MKELRNRQRGHMVSLGAESAFDTCIMEGNPSGTGEAGKHDTSHADLRPVEFVIW